VSRRMDWSKARWDAFKAGARFVLSNDATEADIAEMDAVLTQRRAKAAAAMKAEKSAKAKSKKSSKTHTDRLALWKAAGRPKKRNSN
jgi:hypothetical protein